ncbi:hypothetical protein HK100_010424 [Physocladia obscura]|uniref:SUN domain-containing protein n=1 Tax=Physocladia obscura TaxID=109957 RepID=A0AAD5T2C0_9FUNG|nr:hypothetical protein HK100_010424 [Physocladia obscura]
MTNCLRIKTATIFTFATTAEFTKQESEKAIKVSLDTSPEFVSTQPSKLLPNTLQTTTIQASPTENFEDISSTTRTDRDSSHITTSKPACESIVYTQYETTQPDSVDFQSETIVPALASQSGTLDDQTKQEKPKTHQDDVIPIFVNSIEETPTVSPNEGFNAISKENVEPEILPVLTSSNSSDFDSSESEFNSEGSYSIITHPGSLENATITLQSFQTSVAEIEEHQQEEADPTSIVSVNITIPIENVTIAEIQKVETEFAANISIIVDSHEVTQNIPDNTLKSVESLAKVASSETPTDLNIQKALKSETHQKNNEKSSDSSAQERDESKFKNALNYSKSTVQKKQKLVGERFNHASFDCGALILGYNQGASSATSILVKNKDQYMLNRCKNVEKSSNSKIEINNNANFVIVELCDNIKIDTFMLANFEYFSSTFKEFDVYITEQYPPKGNVEPNKGWKHLGNFIAANIRDSQGRVFYYFTVKDPLFFTRYMKIVFTSYHGSEYYCPMTQLKVFGKTEIEEFREEEESIQAVKEIDPFVCVGESCLSREEKNIVNFFYPPAGSFDAPPVRVSKTSNSPPTISFPANTESTPSDDTQSYVLSADFFRLFMEQEQMSPAIDHNVKDEQSSEYIMNASPSSQPVSGTSQESVFKTMAKRIALLERNSTLSYRFIEEQSRAYHAAFLRVEAVRSESIKKTLTECDKGINRVVHEMGKNYETAWGLLLSDLEKQRRITENRLNDAEKNIEKLAQRVSRQIFYEFVLLISLILLVTRIFSSSSSSLINATSENRTNLSSKNSEQQLNTVPDVDFPFMGGESSSYSERGPSLLQKEDDFKMNLDEYEEDLSSPDDAFYNGEDIIGPDNFQFRLNEDNETLPIQLQKSNIRKQNSPSRTSQNSTKTEVENSPTAEVKNSKSRAIQSLFFQNTSIGSKSFSLPTARVKILDNLGRFEAEISESGVIRSEPTTPSLSMADRFNGLGSKKSKKKRRRSLAGLRLQSQSESVQSVPKAKTP